MGTTEEFDAFYTATARRVLHHVYVVSGDPAEAQDAVQEAYARAWQRWSTISAYDDPEGWVRLVAWRLAAGRWRGVRRWLTVRSRLGPPADLPGPNPDRVALLSALNQLPRSQRQVIVLHYLCDQSVADIAESTGMATGTVKVYLSRARTRLAQLIGTDDEEDTRVATSA